MPEPLHLSIFIPSLRGGGVERTVLILCRGLVKEGVTIDLVLASAEGPFLKELPKEVRIIDLKAGQVAKALPGLVRYLRSERPKVLFSAMNYVNLIAILANELAGKRTHLIIREDNSPTASFSYNRALKAKVIPPLMRRLYKRAGTIVAVSHGVADDLAGFAHLDREQIEVIWNPVVDEDLLAKAEGPLPEDFQFLEEEPFLVAVGALIEQKNFQGLLRSFRGLQDREDLQLLILGEGPLRQELEALRRELNLEDRVHLPGFVSNPYAFMRRSEAFVLSSHFEGLPTVLIEAVACGAPIVSTRCPSGPEEILESGRYGILVPPNDVEALRAGIEECLSKEQDREFIASRGAAFTRERSVESYLDLIRSLSELN